MEVEVRWHVGSALIRIAKKTNNNSERTEKETKAGPLLVQVGLSTPKSWSPVTNVIAVRIHVINGQKVWLHLSLMIPARRWTKQMC